MTVACMLRRPLLTQAPHTPLFNPMSLKSIGDCEAEVRRAEEAAAAAERQLAELRVERDRLQNSRKEVWRSEEELRGRVQALQGELKKRRAARGMG